MKFATLQTSPWVTNLRSSETEVYGANIKYGANKAEPLIGRLEVCVTCARSF
jgi:hypothetical protein